MKKFKILVLVLTLMQLVSFGSSYARKEKQGIEPSAFQPPASQSSREDGVRSKLEALLSPVGVSVRNFSAPTQLDTYRQLRLQWTAYLGAAEVFNPQEEQYSAGQEITILEQRKGKGRLPHQRSLELSTEQLLVIAIDAQGQLQAWTLIADPRIIRAEVPASTGNLSGKRLHRSRPEFLVDLPDHPEITQLRFYHPNWTGKEFTLELVGSASF